MKQRAYSLDALRGYAIITMVLSATVVAGIPFIWAAFGFGNPQGFAARAEQFAALPQILEEM